MTITPTALLSLPIITTGTESGTWGDVVDNGLTSYLDIAIAGGLAITITTADVTLANTAGTSSATGITSTTAQYAILNISGAKTAARNLILPSSSREYTINNAGSGGYLLTVKGSATTGITLVDGEKAIVAWNGSDYVKIASSVITALTGQLAIANGGTNGSATPTAGGIAYGTGTAYAITAAGTAGQAVISGGSSAPTIGTLGVSGGGTGLATITANNVILGNGTSAVQVVAPGTAGNVLTSNGTTWSSTAAASSGPQNTVVYFSGQVSRSGSVMTVISVLDGSLKVGNTVTSTAGTAFGTITSFGTGTGGVGTYNMSASGTISALYSYVTGTTFTIPTGVTKMKVTVVGAGAGGGASANTGCNYGNGGGGGAGGAAIKWLSGLTPGNTLAVTVGVPTSGTSSVASGTQTITTISATAGSAGNTGVPNLSAAGGAGGLGSGGDLNIGGGAGGIGGATSTSATAGGNGGSSILGGGGASGSAGRSYGSGAGGNNTNGSPGVVIFEY
jgi:hypothetical protein